MRTLIFSVLAATVTFAQTDVNFSGKWQIEGGPTGRGGGGRGGPQVLTLNQVGNELTGELGTGRGGGGSAAPVNNEIWDGKVSGKSITFYVWRGSDRPAKVTYKGELNAAGDQITFQVSGGSTGRGGGAGGAASQGASPTQPPPVIAKRTR